MKVLVNILFLASALSVLFTSCERDPDPNDPIKIADKTFSNALFNGALDENGDLLIIDTDGNHNISYVEAEAVTYLNVGNQGITDLSGIEAFINLEYLLCFQNELNDLDLSENTALVGLNCWGNRLSTLDLTSNPELASLDCGANLLSALDVSYNDSLKNLYCSGNQLTELDVSGNSALTVLMCGVNQISALDLTNNPELETLTCSNCQISSLDISRSYDLWILDVTEMTTLTEVCVWEMPFPPEHVLVNAGGSPNTYFTDVCSK